MYTREQFESAATCDDLWNATQKELLLGGKIHGYYRMYRGQKDCGIVGRGLPAGNRPA
ncbi:hypothetical protein SBA4_700009 [Candidatus Sulfopaludibacter sp. SbA4]|nr:hypothetical protein SBA4_700009 [Candidatus Sulfopaludibacter sp. SbA4]